MGVEELPESLGEALHICDIPHLQGICSEKLHIKHIQILK